MVRFDVRSLEWRRWSNVDAYEREGVRLGQMTGAQKAAGLALLGGGLSARGLRQTKLIRRINQAAGELLADTARYNEDAYYFTVKGTPSARRPWGWQFEGHHLAINYFVLGDQVVMTPAFWGSEPTSITSRTYGELRVFDREIAAGLAMVRSLTAAQRARAVIEADKGDRNMLTEAFADNEVSAYAGIRATDLTRAQRRRLLLLVNRFVGTVDTGHARVKMDEVRAHLDETRFAWIGATDEDAVFYFRIQSPVIWIEFDCQAPGPIEQALGAPQVPTRRHIHAIVRTPNGNDYGKELLRQHYATSPHHRG